MLQYKQALPESESLTQNINAGIYITMTQEHKTANLIFVRFDINAYHIYSQWFSDPELARRISKPDDIWFNYVCTTSEVSAWMIYEEDLPIGVIQFETCNPPACFSLVVNPLLRQRGYGKRILHALLALPEVQSLPCIQVEAEHDNIASIRCLKAVGFIQQRDTPDKNGFLEFVYTHKL